MPDVSRCLPIIAKKFADDETKVVRTKQWQGNFACRCLHVWSTTARQESWDMHSFSGTTWSLKLPLYTYTVPQALCWDEDQSLLSSDAYVRCKEFMDIAPFSSAPTSRNLRIKAHGLRPFVCSKIHARLGATVKMLYCYSCVGICRKLLQVSEAAKSGRAGAGRRSKRGARGLSSTAQNQPP